jgi:hypothetical protein
MNSYRIGTDLANHNYGWYGDAAVVSVMATTAWGVKMETVSAVNGWLAAAIL